MKSIDDYQEVKDAVFARQRAEQALEDAKANEQQALEARDRHESDQAEGILQGLSQSGHAKRQQRVEQMQSERRAAQEAVNIANQREKDARERARSYVKRAIAGEHWKALRALDAALAEAEKANARLKTVRAEATDALGYQSAPEPLAWPELDTANNRGCKLTNWRKYCGLDATTERAAHDGKAVANEHGGANGSTRTVEAGNNT